jgi:transposase-like protein
MCPHCQSASVRKKGSYLRATGPRRKVCRFTCRGCRRSFSEQTTSATCGERKPEIDLPLFRLYCSGVSQRRCAEIFGVHRVTVTRKLVRLGLQARLVNRLGRQQAGVKVVVFDEMETFEHSKCKPLSIAVAVEEGSRRILSAHVSRMPAKGPLAAVARRRYGPRQDDRAKALTTLMTEVKEAAPHLVLVKSDECPRYPRLVRRELVGVAHQRFKGRRGCVVGQGELKSGGFDPLFSLNHTCAMFRDNIKRLSRRTWCTTKRPDRLQEFLDLYTSYHNAKLKEPKQPATLDLGTGK